MMNGKKKDRYRITLGLACNADGSEKAEPLFIGKFANPRAFKNLPASDQARGFTYRNNKTAWMTSKLFEG